MCMYAYTYISNTHIWTSSQYSFCKDKERPLFISHQKWYKHPCLPKTLCIKLLLSWVCIQKNKSAQCINLKDQVTVISKNTVMCVMLLKFRFLTWIGLKEEMLKLDVFFFFFSSLDGVCFQTEGQQCSVSFLWLAKLWTALQVKSLRQQNLDNLDTRSSPLSLIWHLNPFVFSKSLIGKWTRSSTSQMPTVYS